MFKQSAQSDIFASDQLPIRVHSVGYCKFFTNILLFPSVTLVISLDLMGRMDIENCIEVSYEKMELKELAAAISWNQSLEELVAYIREYHVCLESK